jgi:hypothetical protein
MAPLLFRAGSVLVGKNQRFGAAVRSGSPPRRERLEPSPCSQGLAATNQEEAT